MICSKFDELSHRDKVEFIGKLVHAVQSSNILFDQAELIIFYAEGAGLFDNVKILPDGTDKELSNTGDQSY